MLEEAQGTVLLLTSLPLSGKHGDDFPASIAAAEPRINAEGCLSSVAFVADLGNGGDNLFLAATVFLQNIFPQYVLKPDPTLVLSSLTPF